MGGGAAVVAWRRWQPHQFWQAQENERENSGGRERDRRWREGDDGRSGFSGDPTGRDNDDGVCDSVVMFPDDADNVFARLWKS
ncbi:hypothetical protein Hanom_Chr01g00039481 [Helianthus anomalus]